MRPAFFLDTPITEIEDGNSERYQGSQSEKYLHDLI